MKKNLRMPNPLCNGLKETIQLAKIDKFTKNTKWIDKICGGEFDNHITCPSSTNAKSGSIEMDGKSIA